MDAKVRDKGMETVLINDKPRRQRLKVGDSDFVPPDGGWGWLIVCACGVSNVSSNLTFTYTFYCKMSIC